MKILKSLFTVAALGLASAAAAYAQVEVRITGSTAFRGPTHTAIRNVLGPNVTYAYVGANVNGASQAIFKGQINNQDVTVLTSWSGSVAGIKSLVNNTSVNFLATSQATSTGGTVATAGTVAANPDVTMADNTQSSTRFTSSPLTERPVGVIGFKWVISKDAPSELTNVTPQLVQALYLDGNERMSVFTGLARDEQKNVFAVGRDPESGTRVVAFAESGVGALSQVVQYQPTLSQDGTAVTSQVAWPAGVINGEQVETGDGGYTSGGTLAGILGKTTSAINGVYLAYLGESDANTAVTAGGRALSYNGVAFSNDAIRNGSYTFWGYEYLTYRGTIQADRKNVADLIAQRITDVDSPILLNSMKVGRSADGGTVTSNF